MQIAFLWFKQGFKHISVLTKKDYKNTVVINFTDPTKTYNIGKTLAMTRVCIFAILILLLNSFHSSGQDLATGIKVGVQAGLSYSGLRVTQPEDAVEEPEFKSIASYNINAYIKYQFARRFGVSVEPGFIIKGSDLDIPFIYLGTAEYRFQYLTMPVLLNYSLIRTFSIGAGIETSYLMKSEVTESPSGNSIDLKDFCDELDLGLVAGIDFGPLKFLDIAVRYSFGMLPVMDQDITDNAGNEVGKRKFYNKMLQLSLRFNFINLK